MADVLPILSALAIASGLVFFLAGSIGLLRLPDVLTRLHALTKADNLGLGLVTAGLLPWAQDAAQAVKLVLVWLLVLAASAAGAHLIARRTLEDAAAARDQDGDPQDPREER